MKVFTLENNQIATMLNCSIGYCKFVHFLTFYLDIKIFMYTIVLNNFIK